MDIRPYLKEIEELEKIIYKFIIACDIVNIGYNDYIRISDIATPFQRELLRRYECWFAITKRIVSDYADNEKSEYFEEKYSELKKHILLEVINTTKPYFKQEIISLLDEQGNILRSIVPFIKIRKTNFKRLITADLINSELEQAEIRYDADFHRASGMIAGVVLERYLKTLCEINKIDISKTQGIDNLANILYTVKILEKTLFKSIQHLASIRNNCSHPNEEVKQQDVRMLLDRTKKITFLSL